MDEVHLKRAFLRLLTPLLLLLCWYIVLPQAALAWKQDRTPTIKEKSSLLNPNSEGRYAAAKVQFTQFLAGSGPQHNRGAWLSLANTFHDISTQQNSSELTMKSKFMEAQTYQEMFARFRHAADAESARQGFLFVADHYADQSLADDSLYKAALLTTSVRDQRPTAQELYQQILRNYPHGDYAAKAQEQLQPAPASPSSSTGIASSSPAKAPPARHPQPTTPAPRTGPAHIEPLQFWLDPNYTRVVIQADNEINFRIHQENNHLLIDFKGAALAPQTTAVQQLQHTVLREYKLTQPVFGQVRADLDVSPSFTYKTFTLADPFRVVVDITGTAAPVSVPQQPMVARAVPVVPPPKLSAAEMRKQHGPQLSLAQQLGLGVKTIVIDPGHGGKDPGAMAFGLQEKRTALANTKKADLFISIHLNANASPTYHGTETYFLNLATDADAMRVAAMENASSTHNIGEMQDILNNLMKNSKIKESSDLARFIQNDLIQGNYGAYHVRNLGVKQAPFYVLIGAKMPAILTEITFITNPTEAGFLKNDQYLDSIAQQLAKGIVAYIDHHRLASIPQQ